MKRINELMVHCCEDDAETKTKETNGIPAYQEIQGEILLNIALEKDVTTKVILNKYHLRCYAGIRWKSKQEVSKNPPFAWDSSFGETKDLHNQ